MRGRISRVVVGSGLCALAWGALACGYGAPQRTQAAQLRVLVEPEQARVYVDERFVASGRALGAKPRAFEPGVHRVTIQAPGFFPHDLEVDLTAGVTTLRVKLRPVPP